MKQLLVIAITVISVAITGPALADPTPDVTAEGDGNQVNTELNLEGQSESKPPSGPVEPSESVYELSPTCGDVTQNPDGTWNCPPKPCGNGDQEYVQVEEDRNGEFQGFEVLCGLPDNSPQSLAIAEFHSTQISVSEPSIAPKTTTLANFPNIYWSDVTTYEQDTDITAANVRLKVIPVSYRWNFGDGETMTTDNPGREWKRENGDTDVIQDVEKNYEVTHRYRKLGTFDTTLTIVFTASTP